MGNYHTATVVASATAAYRLLFYHIRNRSLLIINCLELCRGAA